MELVCLAQCPNYPTPIRSPSVYWLINTPTLQTNDNVIHECPCCYGLCHYIFVLVVAA